MKKQILVAIISILSYGLQSQSNKNDSLLRLISSESVHDTNKVRALNQLGINYYFVTNMEQSQRYLTQSLVKAEKIGYKRGKAVANTILGNISMFRNNNNATLDYSYRAIQLYSEINDTTCQNFISNINNIATVYKQMGVFDKSLESYLRALRISEKINNKNLIIVFNNNIASIYKNKSQYDKAIMYYTNALDICNANEDTLGVYPNIFFGFGDIYFSKKELNKSLSYYMRSLNIGKFIEDSSYMCSANIGIAKVYKAQNKFDTAIKYLNQSFLLKDDERNATSYLLLGEIYLAQNKYKLSQTNLNNSLQLSKKIQFKDLICSNYKNLYQLDSCTKNYLSAMQNHKLYIAYRDSMYNLEGERKIVSTELNYKFDKEKAYIEFEQEKKNSQKNLIITGSIILLIVFIIFSIFIYKSYLGKNKAHKLISYQKHLVEEKQKEIVDNITYAKRIQSAIMPSEEYINKHAKQNFVFYKPKDIVSGDFYWASSILTDKLQDKFYLAVADCTGHGVSGSMMSMLNISILNELVNERNITDTGMILTNARKEIIKALNPKGNENVSDGMDCVLCAFDFENKKLQYSAANNSFYIIRNKEIIVCKSDKMPVGLGMKNDPFKTNEIDLIEGDVVYMFTDGYADQFGGEQNKKFRYKQLEELLLSIHDREMYQQKNCLDTAFAYWKGDYDQTDDVLVIGVKI